MRCDMMEVRTYTLIQKPSFKVENYFKLNIYRHNILVLNALDFTRYMQGGWVCIHWTATCMFI